MHIDLNADLGEGCGNDAALLDVVTSANVACGWHAGDRATMLETICAAMERGVTIGAHPSYPDREHFGRAAMARTPGEVYADVTQQLAALDDCARELGARIQHVKAHGALYNTAARDRGTADAIAHAVFDFDSSLAVVGLAGGEQIESAHTHGLRAIAEVFADRAYLSDGTLVPRDRAGALVERVDVAVEQALRLVRERRGETICIHGDGPHALEFARAIRDALVAAGVTVCAIERNV